MPLWFVFVIVFVGCFIILGLCWYVLEGRYIVKKDIYIFSNKYRKKIFRINEKLETHNSRVKKKMKELECKAIYLDNLKVLHKKSLDDFVSSKYDDFNELYKKKFKSVKEK